MAKDEYEVGQLNANPPKRRGGPMGGHHGPGGTGEKAKNFKGTWKKLISYNKKYVPAILISLLAAAVGTVLTLIGPDKIKELTNIISD